MVHKEWHFSNSSPDVRFLKWFTRNDFSVIVHQVQKTINAKCYLNGCWQVINSFDTHASQLHKCLIQDNPTHHGTTSTRWATRDSNKQKIQMGKTLQILWIAVLLYTGWELLHILGWSKKELQLSSSTYIFLCLKELLCSSVEGQERKPGRESGRRERQLCSLPERAPTPGRQPTCFVWTRNKKKCCICKGNSCVQISSHANYPSCAHVVFSRFEFCFKEKPFDTILYLTTAIVVVILSATSASWQFSFICCYVRYKCTNKWTYKCT